jgi:hypothetical protein
VCVHVCVCVCEDVKEEKKGGGRRERGGVKERGGSEGSERERGGGGERGGRGDQGLEGEREGGRERAAMATCVADPGPKPTCSTLTNPREGGCFSSCTTDEWKCRGCVVVHTKGIVLLVV